MPDALPHLLIFTDLDGTLLDHHSYSPRPADAMIAYLHQASIADVIPVTSKTHAELLLLQKTVPFDHMICITENGSVIRRGARQGKQLPALYMGVTYQEIRRQIDGLPDHLRRHITGFSDLSARQVADATGLPPSDAALAKQREATEPFLWSATDAELKELKAVMSAQNIRIQQGGRFYHLTGPASKAQAMEKIIVDFKECDPAREIVSIALGDGPNDLQMIEAADYGVIMPNPDGVTISSAKPGVSTAVEAGPVGWHAAVTKILDELGLGPIPA